MRILETKFKNLLIINKDTHVDKRGYFRELFINKYLKKKFVFDYMSLSKKNVLRGLHLQTQYQQGKLITVMRGEVFDVCVDCRIKSKTFGKYFSIRLSENNNTSLYIPEGFAHGFVSLKTNTIVHYKCTNYRHKKSETGILWNDKKLKIKWPKTNLNISQKDLKNFPFQEFIKINKRFLTN